MQIKNANLNFKNLSRRSATNRIIIHHPEATTATPQQIHEWHLARGWSGAGYHFLVRKNGEVWALRPEWAIGAHASNNNWDSIGITFEGNFMKEWLNDAQIQAGRELIAYLKSKYGDLQVLRHKDVMSTDCPGKNFDFAAITKSISQGWVKDDKGWWYRNADGTWPSSCWKKLDAWYYFDMNGYALSNCWKKLKGEWYYFGKDCRMKTGWVLWKGVWYYLNEKNEGTEGAMRTGWFTWKGKKYYLQPEKEGAMACDETITVNGKKYTFDKDGALVTK